jgi:hypothetical protein
MGLAAPDCSTQCTQTSAESRGVHIPSARRLEALAAQLVDARQDAEVFVRFGQTGCHLWRDRLWLDHAMNAPQPQAQKLSGQRY